MLRNSLIKGLFLSIVALVSWAFLNGAGNYTQAYGQISNISVSVADKTPAATTTYTIQFTVQNKVPANGGKIYVDIFGLNGAGLVFPQSPTLGSATSPSGLSIPSWGNAGNQISVSTANDISAGSTVKLVITNVVNPTKPGYYFAHIATMQNYTPIDGTLAWGGDYISSYFEVGINTNIKGRISDGSGNGVPFTNYHLHNSSYSVTYYGYTDRNGDYGIGDVPAGTYDFEIYAPPTVAESSNAGKAFSRPEPSSVTVTSGQVTTKNVSFAATTKTLTGKITKNGSTGTPITDATVTINQQGGGWGYATVNTNSNGEYSFSLPGGTWKIYYWNRGTSSGTDWNTCGTNKDAVATFAEDTTVESKNYNFIAQTLDSTVKGRVATPAGTAPEKWLTGVTITNSEGCSFSPQVQEDGSFNSKVVAGAYKLSGWVGGDTYSFPTIENFNVESAATKDLGTLTLMTKTDTIGGTIKDSDGNGVAGVSVSGWKGEGAAGGGGSDWAKATTANDGSYSMKVTPGTWTVSAWPPYNSGYLYSGESVKVSVTSGFTATQNFTFKKATNTIKGKIVDEDGNVITDISASVDAKDPDKEFGGGTYASVTGGTFEMKVPKGTWDLSVYSGSYDYTAGDPVKVTFSGDNQTESVTLKLTKSNATISGTIKDADGNTIKNQWMHIYATKGKYGSWRTATLDQANGTYSIKVGAGTWKLGWSLGSSSVNSSSYYSNIGDDVEVTVASGETKTYDIKLKKLDATITGTTKDSDNFAVPSAWIQIDARDPNQKTSTYDSFFSSGTSPDSKGSFSMGVPAGTYWVSAHTWYGSGYIKPKHVKVTVESGKSSSVDLVFRKSDATITGTVKLSGSNTSAFVTAWSEDGGYSENQTTDGTFSLSTAKGTVWHLKAKKKIDKDVYQSEEKLVDLTNSTSASQELTLEKESFTLPATRATTFTASQQQNISLDDGATLTVPAGAITDTGNVTITAEPTVNLPEEPDSKPVGYGYELTATKDGQDIEKFTSDVNFTVKYTDAVIADAGVKNEKEMKLAYFDETTDTWKELNNCTTDVSANTVTCSFDHFTKFAIVAALDTTPPAAPTNIAASAGDGTVDVTWTKPTDSDFASISIYRSTTSGTQGTLIKSGDTNTRYQDTGLTNNITYYYTVKAVDTSNNQSTNTTQVSAKPEQGKVATLPTSSSSSTNSTSSSSSSSTSSSTTTGSTLPKSGLPREQTSGFVYGLFGVAIVGLFISLKRYRLSRS